ncbi:outer membrane beta-barrel family protein [Bacteroides thetaiotaomicron]|uniref:outer membrane beta-barrel family protein n=1 Tax=Bacteroides thetaiotaomicron TaxID=818 RepID=UPI00232FB39F|nr:outer membrane beta-barrel family protein [Bacteroides thetaiotaomicron]MDC2012499.1 outer membrane beta-barrel family protein [Bacteroides thetaiotaomicron]MDC2016768.1 outer membrane beta-barrel family protein [Bacteroides thetaiotaomicron]MDC2034995.1 outer membrane beta-barrel family protein [Bacteroides thetaiotaomicron]MDC2039318.1 outer membrane beta-barrel family protein [Bacteroides thetaiotaomicron]MDC2043811.1 outer membrane beta-barrel family protein [Bacteroides thetaiotaomicro
MKYSILFVLLLIVSLNASAQMFSGRVLDDQKIPVQYATVALLSVADSSLISGTVTDEQGIFKIEVSESKPYLLAVSYVGYKRSIQRLMPSIIGDIVIIPDDRMLDEVVVTQHLPLYRLDNGGLTTKVENTILSKAGTAMNVAELLPGVLKRPDGTLEVLGKGTPLIYINNREVRHLDELDRLSAENIKQVELITNPGAEYGAAVGAVLKLKTVGKKIDGFGIGFRSVADYSYKIGNNDQLNVEYRQNGLDLFGTFQYRLQHLKETGETVQMTDVDTLWEQRTHSTDLGKNISYFGQFGFNYEINKNHSFGATYELTSAPRDKMSNDNRTEVYADHELYDVWNTNAFSIEKTYPTHHSNFYYHGDINSLEIDLNADVLVGKNKEEENIKELSLNYDDLYMTTFNETSNKLYAGKLVWAYPLFKGRISGGSEYSYIHRISDFSGFGNQILGTSDKIRERNLAFFLNCTWSLGGIDASAGLRYEDVKSDFYENSIYQSDESKHYRNLFPSLSLKGSAGKVHWGLGYHIQVARPYYEQLKNEIHYGNRFTYLGGTPNLQPTYIHTAEMRAAYRDLQLSVGYNRYNDDILFSIEQATSDPKITLIKFRNVEHRDEMTASLVYSPGIGCWRPEWVASVQSQWFNIGYLDGTKNMNGITVGIRWNNSFQLPMGYISRLNGTYTGKGVYQNSFTRPVSCFGVSIYKSFFNGRLDCTVEGNDLFHTVRDATTQYDNKVKIYRETQRNTQEVKLTVHYKFNLQKSKYKGTGAGLDEQQRL